MLQHQIKMRSEVAEEDKWDLYSLYTDMEEWEKEFSLKANNGQPHRCPEFIHFQGKLGDGAATVKKGLQILLSNQRTLEKLYTFAHLKHDEDIANEEYKKAYARILSLIQDYHKESAWFEPELLSLPTEKLIQYVQSPELAEYSFYLEKIFRMKAHTLSHDGEVLLALAGNSLQAAHRAFSAMNDADFHFGKVEDGQGRQIPMTHASYSLYLRSQDRALRKNAFTQYLSTYVNFENTLTEILAGQIQGHVFQTQARKYRSCLEAALFPNNIPTSVYHSLIEAVNQNLGSLHKYIALRKKILQLDDLHLYDLYVPLTSDFDVTMNYAEAEDLVIESVKPLGDEYQNALRKGLKDQQWADRYENKNKRSGAYSNGCYDSNPFILMNYNQTIRDIFTLAHEAGHSMHSLLSRSNQPYHYSSYPIFVAEVASTFNEELLLRSLLERTQDHKMIFYLLNQKVEDIRATLFRQTMFAEFELKIHEMQENHHPITPSFLKEFYHSLNQKYLGDQVIVDPEIDIEWARIPHFYYNFYVYQYATGISAALTLSEKVLQGDREDQDAYLTFLQGGCHKYPIELLKDAGVDMTTPHVVNIAIQKFDALVDQLELAYQQLS